MRYITSTIAAFTFAGAVGLCAQEPAPPTSPPAQSPAQSAPKSTLTGCVTQAKTTDGGTAYVLSKVEGGTAGMYLLRGQADADLLANVNKKIEVTGPVQEPSSTAAPDPKVVRPPLITVESMKVVAQSCS